MVAAELGLPESDPNTEVIYLRVYKEFMEAMDGIDNGVNQYDASVAPRYVSRTDLSSRVAGLNPTWLDPFTPEAQRAGFDRAVALTGAEFLDKVRYYGRVWLPARSVVAEALAGREAVHPTGAVLRLARVAPWKEHLYDIERELGLVGLAKYVLYEDEKKAWRVQAVGVGPASFDSRKALPAAWRGLRDEALSEVAGVPGCGFCHASGFIGGNATFEGARAMAVKALELE